MPIRLLSRTNKEDVPVGMTLWTRHCRRIAKRAATAKTLYRAVRESLIAAGSPTEIAGVPCDSAHEAAILLGEIFETPEELRALKAISSARAEIANELERWISACASSLEIVERVSAQTTSEYLKARRDALTADLRSVTEITAMKVAALIAKHESDRAIDDADRLILQTIGELEALSEERRVSRKEIHVRLNNPMAKGDAPGNLKKRLAALVTKGYSKVNNSSGRRGGYWLSDDGRAAIATRK